MKKVNSVSAYIESAPKNVRGKLKEIRAAIRKAAPKAEEKISYGIPYYGYHGRLIYFAYAKNHIGLYMLPKNLGSLRKEVKKYQSTRATLHFPLDKKLPIALIKKLVKARMKENEKGLN